MTVEALSVNSCVDGNGIIDSFRARFIWIVFPLRYHILRIKFYLCPVTLRILASGINAQMPKTPFLFASSFSFVWLCGFWWS